MKAAPTINHLLYKVAKQKRVFESAHAVFKWCLAVLIAFIRQLMLRFQSYPEVIKPRSSHYIIAPHFFES